ncbi:MAG TPA: ParA family protein, partial [Pyrinomonadaceae bacterium]|nr:ParA family protein [Pyrinomonadaceae bacterium]
TVSLINMKGGVGKTTLAFNLAWYCAWQANMKVLAVDLDPQSNLSQYLMGAKNYLAYMDAQRPTIVEVFEQFSPPRTSKASPSPLVADDVIHTLREWDDGSSLSLVPSRLELAWTLKNPTDKSELLPQFLAEIEKDFDLIVIDCAPTESILTTAAYRSSRYIVVPVKPEFLATIGLPLLARSLDEFRLRHKHQTLEMAGIVFNDKRRVATPPEQRSSMKDIKRAAQQYGWPVFDNAAHHSDSFPTGSRASTPIFRTGYARDYVKGEFSKVAEEFIGRLGLK